MESERSNPLPSQTKSTNSLIASTPVARLSSTSPRCTSSNRTHPAQVPIPSSSRYPPSSWTPPRTPPQLPPCRAAGLRPRRWSFRLKLTQQAYAAWLKIPILTETMMPDLDPAERARRIDCALGQISPASWKWERWKGFTAWK